jgi:hypothetical protein
MDYMKKTRLSITSYLSFNREGKTLATNSNEIVNIFEMTKQKHLRHPNI